MIDFHQLLEGREDWLLERILERARGSAPPSYLAALKEVWHISFQGITTCFLAAVDQAFLSADPFTENRETNPMTRFGEAEAKRHRERGVDLEMFLELPKLYRPAYLALVADQVGDPLERAGAASTIERFFARVESAFCMAWLREAERGDIKEMQTRNLDLMTERDRYVSVFESLPLPILLLDPEGRLRNLNHAASNLFFGPTVPGAWFYQPGSRPSLASLEAHSPGFSRLLLQFQEDGTERREVEWTSRQGEPQPIYRVVFSRMLDLPSVFAGTLVIFEDLTERRASEREREGLITQLTQALAQVKQLSGLLPICAWCKKVRDDQGYWNQLEDYFATHSNLTFSHGICPECADRLTHNPPGPASRVDPTR